MIYQAKKPYHYGTGRRKSSVARVRLYEGGTGKITINDRDIDDYFGLETLKLLVRQPLEATNLIGTCDVVATVQGGGVTGQAGAIRHGLARALLTVNEEYRPILKQAGLLTRDPRMKERKKYGLKAARRAPQFSKPSIFIDTYVPFPRRAPRERHLLFLENNRPSAVRMRRFHRCCTRRISDAANGWGCAHTVRGLSIPAERQTGKLVYRAA